MAALAQCSGSAKPEPATWPALAVGLRRAKHTQRMAAGRVDADIALVRYLRQSESGAVPETEVIIFVDDKGSAPFLSWLDRLSEAPQNKCLERIERLKALGHELRRPHADLLRDGIHELRVRSGRAQYRVFYFFHDRLAVISHGCRKERIVPVMEVNRAIANREKFARNPERHTMTSE